MYRQLLLLLNPDGADVRFGLNNVSPTVKPLETISIRLTSVSIKHCMRIVIIYGLNAVFTFHPQSQTSIASYLPSEIRRHFSPAFRLPFQYRHTEGVCLEPLFCPCYHIV